MKNVARLSIALALAASLMGELGACSASRGSGPYTGIASADRDPQRSRELLLQATKARADDPSETEQLLREALAADLYNGPAHNNLGIIHLSRGELYEAANEFEWARKLMPGNPDPRLNLALTLEQAGQVDESLRAYTAALDVYPGYLPALQGRTRLEIQSNRVAEHTAQALSDIAMRGDEQWRAWALLWTTKLTGQDW